MKTKNWLKGFDDEIDDLELDDDWGYINDKLRYL